jgi:hypothetical protein
VSKQEHEFAIFSTVYDPSAFAQTDCSDKPDIRARRTGESWFGVEITELFPSQTDARTHTDPAYVSQVLAGKPVKHRDDAVRLAVSPIQITNEDGSGSSATVQGIWRQHPSHVEHYDALLDRINDKTLKAEDYDHSLDHTNLIVLDHFPPESGPFQRWSLADVLTPEARLELANSPFREIFWVTRGRNGKRVYRPLQAALLLERFWGFRAALKEWSPDIEFGNEALVSVFLHVAAEQGTPLIPARDDVGWLAVTHGWGIRATDRGVLLADYADQSPPTQPVFPEIHDKSFSIAEFAEFESGYRSQHEFECEFVTDARPVPELR